MKKLKIVILLGIMISLLLLTGCGYGELKGTVIDKKYSSAYSTTSFISTGKTMMPITQFHPESWKIQIQKEEARRNKNNMGIC